jgi:tetratricopeptide (TPR) repeat protein
MAVQQFEPKRSVEISSSSYGTGYRIGGRLVLTAAHLLADKGATCQVRSKDTFGEVEAEVVWKARKGVDIALVKLPETIDACEAVVFGKLPLAAIGETISFQMYGYPRWGRTLREVGTTAAGGRQIEGVIYLADTSPDGLLVLEARRLPPEGVSSSQSEWAGASGSAIVCNGLVVAVQSQHQNPSRAASLEAALLAQVDDDQQWRNLLQQHGIDPEPQVVTLKEWEKESRLGQHSPANPVTNVEKQSRRNLPLTRYFTGREEQLRILEEILVFTSTTPENGKMAAIVGGGGYGKSDLAAYFAKDHLAQFSDGVFWLRVENKDADTIARDIARKCGEVLDSEDERDANALIQDIFTDRQMLLIFDGVEEAKEIKAFCHQEFRYSTIVTTRMRDLPFHLGIEKNATIDLQPLPEANSLELLKKILTCERVENALVAVKRLANLVGHSPLALQILGAALRMRKEPLENYVKTLEEEKERLLQALSRPVDQDYNVEASLNLSLKWLLDNEESIDFFACLSVCASDSFAMETAMQAAGCSSHWQAQEWLWRLYDLSLLNYANTESTRFVLHTLVRSYAEKLAQTRGLLAIAQERHARFFVQWLKSSQLKDEASKVADNLSDIILATEWLKNHEIKTTQVKVEIHEFVLNLQPLFEEYGYWQKAITLMKQFQRWAEELQDWDAVVRHEMHEARYLSRTEEYEQAEVILNKAQINLGKIEDLSTRQKREVKVLSVLGGIFEKQQKLEKAIQVFEREAVLEAKIDDAKALAILHIRLGRLYKSQEQFEKAQYHFEQSIQFAQNCSDSTQVVSSLNNLGDLSLLRGDTEKAQQFWSQAIRLISNSGDPKKAAATAISRAGKLRQRGRLSEALQILLLGSEFYAELEGNALASTLRGLVGSLYRSKHFSEALVATQALIKVASNTDNHRENAIAHNRLGEIYQKLGELEKAQKAFEQEIVIAKSYNDKLQRIIGLQSLFAVLLARKQENQAQDILEEVLALIEEFGKCEASAISLMTLAGSLYSHKKYSQSLKLFLMVAEHHQYINHRTLIQSLRSVAGDLHRHKKHKEALQAVQAAIPLCLNGNNQRQLSYLKNILGKVLQATGDLEGAKQAFLEQIKIDRTLNNPASEAIGLDFIGKVFKLEGNLKEAQYAFAEEVRVCDENAFISQLNIGLTGLGYVFLDQRNADEAELIFERRILLLRSSGELQGAAILAFSLGQKLFNAGFLHQALKILLIAAELHANMKSKQLVSLLKRMAEVFYSQGNFEKALEAIAATNKIYIDTNNTKQLLTTNNLLKKIIERFGKDKSLAFCDLMLKSAPEHSGFLDLQTEIQWL